ncbi:MAG: hypothetical protein GX879_00055 [Bacteroidales bacterium]|nr:hypothetical protein [Bacteroidales bacterium]
MRKYNTYKLGVLIYAFLFCVNAVSAQETKHSNPISSEKEILQIAKDKNLILKPLGVSDEEIAKTKSYQAKVKFDKEKSVWIITSEDYKTTNRGKCKKTNGCTIVRSKTVWIDDKTHKILKKKTSKKKLSNYE